MKFIRYSILIYLLCIIIPKSAISCSVNIKNICYVNIEVVVRRVSLFQNARFSLAEHSYIVTKRLNSINKNSNRFPKKYKKFYILKQKNYSQSPSNINYKRARKYLFVNIKRDSRRISILMTLDTFKKIKILIEKIRLKKHINMILSNNDFANVKSSSSDHTSIVVKRYVEMFHGLNIIYVY